jgi:hypothetical protein
MPPARRPTAKRKAPAAADGPEPTPLPRGTVLAKQKQRKRFVWSERLHADFITAGTCAARAEAPHAGFIIPFARVATPSQSFPPFLSGGGGGG